MAHRRYLFGLRKDVKDNVHYVDDVTLVYPAGHNIVVYWTDSKTQKFVPGNLESEDITAITLSPNKRFLAMAERAEKGMITIFDLQTLKRRKVLVSVDTGSKVNLNVHVSRAAVIAIHTLLSCR